MENNKRIGYVDCRFKYSKFSLVFCLMCLFMDLFILQIQAQNPQVNIVGNVQDQLGEPIIGANIMERGTTNGVITDIDGNFSLNVDRKATLVISFIGYKSQEIKVVPGKNVNITLTEDTEMLEEVVVVGFGTQKKANLTGAVDVVGSKELIERPVANAAQALQGLVPGLQITQTRGSLEDRPSINVRGTTTIGQGTSGTPLVLIDGMEGDLNTINPQDIANISILKDAAASSIYGSRAPFGVVLVTTKSGGQGGKISINYNNNFRFSTPINMNHMMNSVEFGSFINDAMVNGGNSAWFGDERMVKIKAYHEAKPYGPGQRITSDGSILYSIEPEANGQWKTTYENAVDDVDWYDVIYKDHTFSQEHNFSANGGSEKFNYYSSFNFFDQGGYMKLGDEDFKRYNVTTKINSQLTNWLNFNYTMRFTREDYIRPSSQTDALYSNMSQSSWPILPLYDRNGYYISHSSPALGLAEGGSDRKQTDNSYHLVGFTLEPLKDWVTHIDFNYRITSANRHWDQQVLYNHDINGSAYVRDPNSNVHEDYYKENYYNFNVRTEYSYLLEDKHQFHIMAGFQAEELNQIQFGLQRNGVMIPGKPEVDLTNGLDYYGETVTPSTNGSRNSWSTAGFFGRLNYDYQGKYLFEANVRADGSSRFRKGNQWKTFPSVSAGWNIAKESFMEDLSGIVDLLKIRLSYGSLGNQNTTNWYQTFQTMTVQSAAGNWLQKGVKPNVAWAPGLVSETLTWETVQTYNIGLDWGLFRNRLTGSFNWYIRDTKNMVGNAPELPAMLGTKVPITNNTDLRTKGWELNISWRDLLKNGLSYGVRFTLFDSRSKITRYPNNPTGNLDNYIEGRFLNEIWGYETKGMAKTDEEMQQHLASLPNGGQDAFGSNWKAGDIMYVDVNKDGKIDWGAWTINDRGDAKVIGNSTPRYQFGLDMDAFWKGFDVRIFFQGVMKRDYWQGSNYLFGYTDSMWWATGLTQINDYFRNEDSWSVQNGYRDVNVDAYLPRPVGNWKNIQKQTRYLQDASYIRLKNLQVGYTFPVNLTSKWGIQRLRFYVSGENLWTGTNIASQFDPETIDSNGGNGYPLSRTLSCGLSITF